MKKKINAKKSSEDNQKEIDEKLKKQKWPKNWLLVYLN